MACFFRQMAQHQNSFKNALKCVYKNLVLSEITLVIAQISIRRCNKTDTIRTAAARGLPPSVASRINRFQGESEGRAKRAKGTHTLTLVAVCCTGRHAAVSARPAPGPSTGGYR